MTFSVSRDGGEFEWSGINIFTFFCQLSNLFRAESWKLIYEIARFNATAVRFISRNSVINETLSIGDYLKREGYSSFFADNYLMVGLSFAHLSLYIIIVQPMTACVWSTPPDTCFADFPAATLVGCSPLSEFSAMKITCLADQVLRQSSALANH